MGAKPVELEEIFNCDCVVLMTDHNDISSNSSRNGKEFCYYM
jgi:hypothetical protein